MVLVPNGPAPGEHEQILPYVSQALINGDILTFMEELGNPITFDPRTETVQEKRAALLNDPVLNEGERFLSQHTQLAFDSEQSTLAKFLDDRIRALRCGPNGEYRERVPAQEAINYCWQILAFMYQTLKKEVEKQEQAQMES